MSPIMLLNNGVLFMYRPRDWIIWRGFFSHHLTEKQDMTNSVQIYGCIEEYTVYVFGELSTGISIKRSLS